MTPRDVSLQDETEPLNLPSRFKVSLFWRTFFLLAILIFCCSLAWLQLYRTQGLEPRQLRNAHQMATVVNMAKTALMQTDVVARDGLLRTLVTQEKLELSHRQAGDRIVAFGPSPRPDQWVLDMVKDLGTGTVVASEVNGKKGLWVGFDIGPAPYWLKMDTARLQAPIDPVWLTWAGLTLVACLMAAALTAGLINLPLKRLSLAAGQLREGHFNPPPLDEKSGTNEIRTVNIGFNRMAERLAKIEQERALMLAGISHDLRTPLARLRLETELSVDDLETRDLMATDIAQLDAIIDKFMDYARPEPTDLGPVLLTGVISRSITPWRNHSRFEISVEWPRTCKSWPSQWSWVACCPTCWKTPDVTGKALQMA